MSEEFYDENIAPELARLAKLCADNGMSFEAIVEYSPGDIGETRMFTKTFSWSMEMISLAVAAMGNVDKFLLIVAALAKNREDLNAESSLVLRMLRGEEK